MIGKKDKLKPTQPYFVLETDNFYQEVYLRQGISHFFTFRLEESKAISIVPDACIDLIFVYGPEGMESYAAGSVLHCKKFLIEGKREYFGVRFMPGYQPAGINVLQRDLIETRINLYDILADREQTFFQKMSEQKDFYQRIRIFLEEYTKLEKRRSKPFGKEELVISVKDFVYDSGGLIRISELSAKTGYSERYINKVFIEQMGFPPKTFCRIIRFQRALWRLNYGVTGKMTDLAADLGYYDQSQFIKDFKQFCGITPKQYMDMAESGQYRKKVHVVPKNTIDN